MRGLMDVVRKIDRDTKKCRGSILILVLVFVVFLAALVFRSQAMATARQTSNMTDLDLVRLRGAMNDGVQQGRKLLEQDVSLSVDDPREPWNQPLNLSDPSGVETRVVIRVLNDRFDLNNLFIEVPDITVGPLKDVAINLFSEIGDFAPEERVEALIDWIDPDDSGFYERSHYQTREPFYEPANYWLNSWSDVLQVEGFDQEYFLRHARKTSGIFTAGFQETFVIIPDKRARPIPVNINFADRGVLLGLFEQTEQSTVEAILAYRKENVIVDLNIFLLRLDEDKAKALGQVLSTSSSYFSIESGSYFNKVSARTRAIVRRAANGKTEVIKWVL